MNTLHILLYIIAGILCLSGITISLLALSGSWLIIIAGIILKLGNIPNAPSWTIIIILITIAIALEIIEGISSYFGVKKRGGSNLAGLAAGIGSFVGAIIGSILIPIPVIGSLIGLLSGGFLSAYAVEYAKIKHNEKAIHIATGTIIAKLFIMVLKIIASIIMTILVFYH